jgi:hypothetical protein
MCNPREPAYAERKGIMDAMMRGNALNADVIAATGYCYVEGCKPEDPISILAFERNFVSDGRNVLYGTGSVEFVDEAAFQKALAKQLAKADVSQASSSAP